MTTARNAALLRESAPDIAATVERARAGDRAAMRALIVCYQGRVARFARSMLPAGDDEWEDVAQAVFVKMILSIERLQSPATFESWLFRIARNASLDHLRRRRWRRIFIPWERHHDQLATTPSDAGNARLAQIDRALAQLPMDQRELILLMRENEWTYNDLARIVGASSSAVKSRLFRARTRLRSLLEQGDEP
jgi:RNA polymerase sigma-70 factor, ECF subfamily